jgi:TrkA domain protein
VFGTERGYRVGVIAHRTGRRDLVVYDRHDPDRALLTVKLTPEEANALAEMLGTTRIIEHLAELQRQVEGLVTEQIMVEPGSPYDGRLLADTATRTRTGASIVAVVRDREVVASPRTDFRFAAGDVVVVVGTPEGTRAVGDIFTDG